MLAIPRKIPKDDFLALADMNAARLFFQDIDEWAGRSLDYRSFIDVIELLGIEASQNALTMLEYIYAKHFYTDEQRLERLDEDFQMAGPYFTVSSPVQSDNPGGIDLNPQAIEMDKSGNGVDFPVPAFDPTQFQNIEGFLPIIINISPITNIPLLLGLAPAKPISDRLRYGEAGLADTEAEEESTDLGFESLDPLDKKDRFKIDEPKQLSLLN